MKFLILEKNNLIQLNLHDFKIIDFINIKYIDNIVFKYIIFINIISNTCAYKLKKITYQESNDRIL